MRKIILFVLLTVLTMSCSRDENNPTAPGYIGKWHPYKVEATVIFNGTSYTTTELSDACQITSFIDIANNGNVTGENYELNSSNQCLKDGNVSGTYHDNTKKITLSDNNGTYDYDVTFINGEMILKQSSVSGGSIILYLKR